MTKSQLLRVFKTGVKIAELLGISRSAVSRWPMDEPIPPLRQYQLREKVPSINRRIRFTTR